MALKLSLRRGKRFPEQQPPPQQKEQRQGQKAIKEIFQLPYDHTEDDDSSTRDAYLTPPLSHIRLVKERRPSRGSVDSFLNRSDSAYARLQGEETKKSYDNDADVSFISVLTMDPALVGTTRRRAAVDSTYPLHQAHWQKEGASFVSLMDDGSTCWNNNVNSFISIPEEETLPEIARLVLVEI